MFNRRLQTNHENQRTSAMLRVFSIGNWRAVVGLVTALAFISILLTASTHHHETTVEDQACAVCSVAIQKIANTNLVVLPKMVAVLVFYANFVLESRIVAHIISLYLPPSCGPPRSPAAIH